MLEATHLNQQAISLPITQAILSSAEKMAQKAIPSLRARIISNAVAVAVVNTYMEMMAFATELSNSDSWNPLINQFSDVADLQLTNIGCLECRSFDRQSNLCKLPIDLPLDCVGLIALQLEFENDQALLLGFAPRVKPGDKIAQEQLQPLDELFDYLENLEPKTIDLTQWIEGNFGSPWQIIQDLVGESRWNLALGLLDNEIVSKSLVGGAKIIDFGVFMGQQAVIFLVTVIQVDDGIYELNVQLHPIEGISYLPADMKLALLSDIGTLFMEVSSRKFDNFIQLPKFRCNHGERFSIEVIFNEMSITETFMV